MATPPLFGASVLSAAGSLPLHLLPLVVAAVVLEERASVAQAGWIASAFMLGQLLVAVGLPLARVSRLPGWQALAASALLVGMLIASASAGFVALLACWTVIGCSCGALIYLGMTAAAAHQDRALAFSIRLSIVLFLAGLAIAGFRIAAESTSYDALAHRLSIAFSLAAALGLLLYRLPEPVAKAAPAAPGMAPARGGQHAGLLIVFLLFAGQLGFWAYALEAAARKGIDPDEAIWAIAACKILAGAVLLPLAYRARPSRSQPQLLVPGAVLVAGIAAIYTAGTVGVFLLGLLAWEVGLNVLSSRLQARAVEADPGSAGTWLTAAILLGAAVGPALQGLAIAGDLWATFAVFALASALLPALWERRVFARTGSPS